MASNINMIETESIEMSERIGHSFLQRQTQKSLKRAAATIASPISGTSGKDSRISQGEIDDTILKESKKIVEFDDLPKGILKKLLNKINRQSFNEDPNAEIEIHEDYSFDDVQTSSMSLREKMQICNEVCKKTYVFVSFICPNFQLT